MRPAATLSVALALAFGACASSAGATTTLPPADGFVSCDVPGGNVSDPAACGTGYDGGTRALGPYAALSAFATYPGGLVALSSGVFAVTNYSFTVDGPDPYAKVSIDIDTRLHQSTVNNGYAFSEILVTAGTDIFTTPNSANKVICSESCRDESGDFAGTLQIIMNPGYISTVHLEIEASAGFAVDPNSGYASADPFIYVDPSTPDAAAYKITLSDGVANGLPPAGGVPEPASWALMLTGFGVLGAATRRHRVRRAGKRFGRFVPVSV